MNECVLEKRARTIQAEIVARVVGMYEALEMSG